MRSMAGIRDISRERFKLESFVPAEHPLRRIRSLIDSPLGALHDWLALVCSAQGRSSIAPEQTVRALLLQVLYSIRRNRQLIEQIWYSRSFRWFVGLRIDEPKWNHAIFSMYREQLLQHEILREVLVRVLSAANREGLVSAQAMAAGRSELARGTWGCVPDGAQAGTCAGMVAPALVTRSTGDRQTGLEPMAECDRRCLVPGTTGADDREEGWMAGSDNEVVFRAGSSARRLIGR
jgi:transposase